MAKIQLNQQQMQRKAINVMIAAAIINEAETWSKWVKPELGMEAKIAADNVAIACKRFRVKVAGKDNLDVLTDFSEVFSDLVQTMLSNPDKIGELLAILTAFKNGEIRQED